MSEETAETRLEKTVFIVEATSFEQHCLWGQHASDSWMRPKDYEVVTWEQINGWLITVGEIGKRPVCISTSWVKINGALVMFYEQCSQVCDSVQTKKWVDKHFNEKWDNGHRPARCDAMNFGHCLSAIKEHNSKP